MKKFLIPVLTLVLMFTAMIFSSTASAACHVVTAAGSGAHTGADWNNAFTGIPVTLTRGDVYYLADGSYGDFTFSQAVSGTTTVEIRKAQLADHCSPTGWNPATMGSAQAVFTSVSMSKGFLTVNGNGTQTTPGCGSAPNSTFAGTPPVPTDCGIKVDNSACTGGADACDAPVYLGDGNASASATGGLFEYVEFKGNNNNSSEKMFVFAPFNRNVTGAGATFTHIFGHNAGCVYFQDGGDGRVVSYSYFWHNNTNASGCHGQYSFYDVNDSNGTEAYNVYRDMFGTAIWTFALSSGTHTGWKYYGNVIWQTNSSSGGIENGILACINSGVNCNNFSLYQNSIIGVSGPTGVHNESTGSYSVENNLWYGSGQTVTFDTGSGGTYTQNHNSFLVSGVSCPSGTANVCANASANPFTNWPSGDFTLASDTANWNNRIALVAPYNLDVIGTTFSTDRGAYQFVSGAAPPPVVPHAPAIFGSLPTGTVGTAYSAGLRVSGDSPPNAWFVNPTLPSGLTMNQTSGLITGTPNTAGTFPQTFTVTDSYVCTANDPVGCTSLSAPFITNLVINFFPTCTTLAVNCRISTLSSANIRATATNNGFGTMLGTEPASALGTIVAVSTSTVPNCTANGIKCVWIQVTFDTCTFTSTPKCTGWMGSDNMKVAAQTPPPVSITISASSISVLEGMSVQFMDTVTNASDTSVTWSANAPGGLYTAPMISGTSTVTVTSVADPTKSASAIVTVTVPPPSMSTFCSWLSDGVTWQCNSVTANIPSGQTIKAVVTSGTLSNTVSGTKP